MIKVSHEVSISIATMAKILRPDAGIPLKFFIHTPCYVTIILKTIIYETDDDVYVFFFF